MGYDQSILDAIYYPTVCLASVSVLCNVYAATATKRFKKQLINQLGKSAPTSHDYILCYLINLMSINDLFFALSYIPDIMISKSIAEVNGSASTACLVFGFACQYFATCSAFYKLLIPLFLLYLLTTNSKKQRQALSNAVKNKRVLSYLGIIIPLLSFVGSVLPLIWDNSNHYALLYSYTKDGYSYGAQCWVEGYWELIFYGIVILSVLFDIITLVIGIYKYNKTKIYTNAYLLLMKRLFTWVIVFLIVRIVPGVDRMLEVFADANQEYASFHAPLWLVLLHNYLLSSYGIANGVVWYFNRNVLTGKNTNDDDDKLVATMDTIELEELLLAEINTNNKYNNMGMSGMSGVSSTNFHSKQPRTWQSFDTTSDAQRQIVQI